MVAPGTNNKNAWRLLRYVRPYWRQAAAAFLAMLFTSSSVLALGAALRYLVDEGIGKGNAHLLDRAFIILLGVILLLAVATYIRFSLVAMIGERTVAEIRKDVYARLLSMHIGYFERVRTGDLLSRLTADTTLLQTIVGSSVSMAVRNMLLLVGGFILLLATSPRLTAYVLMMTPLVIAPILFLGRRVRGLARSAQDKVGDVSAHAEETLSAIRTVQALALEPHENTLFRRYVEAAKAAGYARIRQRALLTAIVIALVFGAVMTVLWFGGRDVLAGHISAGDLSAFVFYSIVVAGAAGAISEVMADFQRAAGAAERISELLTLEPEIAAPPVAEESGQERTGGGVSIAFDRVSFAYPSRPEKPALADFTLDVKAGETVAVVGPSGAGKTTVFQLLLRFYDPDIGAIHIGGLDIKAMPLMQLRGAIGIVPQDPVIFSGTARDNIRLGKLDAADEDIMRAAETASALEFLEKLPQGLDTHLGEKGIRLSGGQRQRLAIARAIIRNPRILLLDEATSALDSENERQIQEAMERAMQGRTTLVIAHRLSTVVRADRIVLLNEGRIEHIGSHRALMAESPLYARLAELQFQPA